MQKMETSLQFEIAETYIFKVDFYSCLSLLSKKSNSQFPITLKCLAN